jgi:hypothetical protein
MTSYFLIGDIHSQGSLLAKALAYAKSRNLTPIFLGDLFDSRCENSETIYVYHQVRLAEKEMGAIVLNSNHQERLLNFLHGDTEPVYYTEETWRTLAEFQESGLDLDEVIGWLSSLPLGYVFQDSRGVTYGCAHAYYPEHLLPSHCTEKFKLWSVDSESLAQDIVWGPHKKDGRRRWWWKEKSSRDWVRCAGHYHTVWVDEHSIVLDANCGYEAGLLPCYEVEAKVLVHFSDKMTQSIKAPRN